MYVESVCVYIIMDIYTYMLSLHEICKKVLAYFTSQETFKLISSLCKMHSMP